MKFQNTIGKRLILSISFMTVLTISVSLIAAITWEALDDQVNTIVEKNIPTLKTSYQLERNTAGLQAALNKLSNNTDPLLHAELKQKLDDQLAKITAAINHTSLEKMHSGIKTEHETLLTDTAIYANLLYRRNTHRSALAQTKNSIKWLHQDLVDELTPIRQEVEWQLTRMLPNAINTDAIGEVMTEFSLIQSITVHENELHQLVQEIILQRQNRDIGNAFYFIGYKTEEVSKMSQGLNHYPSTISYRQLLQELITIVEPEGILEQQLRLDVELNNAINQFEKQIQIRLKHQEEVIQAVVEKENNSLRQLNEQTRQAVRFSNLLLFIVVILSIFLSVILSIYLVGRGIVKRLNMLSQDLAAVANDQLNAKIQISGSDEIGKLGDNLRHFCRQMQEMQQSNALNLINNTQASIITCDLNGKVESVNPSAQALFRYDTFPSHQTIWSLFSTNMQQRLQTLFLDASPLLLNGACQLTLKHEQDPDNDLYLRLDFRLFQQGTSDKIIITMTDITEQENAARWLENMVREKTQSLTNRNRQLNAEIEDRKRVEADLRSTQDELIQAAKMAVVGQTMTSLAHELNQPLSAISTHVFATRMAIEKENYTQLPNSLEKIDNLTSRMGRIVASLRSFSKKQSASSPLKSVDIPASFQQALLIVESRAKVQKTNISCTIDDPLFAKADQVQLEQVLVNLLVNGCDAVAGCELREITVCELAREDNRIRIAVSDSGNGFATNIIQKLFIPFTTTKEVGLGLGLSICRSIMNRFDGDIFLASNLQGGAMVVLELNKYDDK
ncbi:ATP-binding protein [uncultured Photobacterium sp.]|uniref:ATP-binding protein n=1 Tax=uncultured Photobacterium sp. TaxID=173973 RepID=UPI002630AC06|nr:ATP-binding protein [uncultured Photobacterium sp.]